VNYNDILKFIWYNCLYEIATIVDKGKQNIMDKNKILTIGICDDDEICLERVIACIKGNRNLFQMEYFNVKILSYNSPDKIMRAFADVAFNLVILDIEMPDINGFHIAKVLQNKYPEIHLAFISNHDNYVFDAYDFEVLRFIRKSHLEKDMAKTLRKFLEKIADTFVQLKLTGGYGVRNFWINDIFSFESFGHNLVVKTRKGDFEMYSSLTQVEKQLEKYFFVRIHRSYLVNPLHIEKIANTTVQMSNGLLYDIGKNKREQILKRISEYDNFLEGRV